MGTIKIQDILIEHSNALRALLKASRSHGKEAENHIKSAAGNVRSVLESLDKYGPDDVPPETRERAENAVAYLENGNVDEARVILLEMGRAFDDFLRK